MKVVFLYAGQGSQRVGMGKDFYDTFDEYRKIIDESSVSFDMKTMMHEGPLEELTKTEHTQCCMAAFAAGVTAVLSKNGIRPDGALGLSLGEYGALHIAGVYDAHTYLKLTELRGRVMMEAAKGKECSMSAILGMEPAVVEEACKSVKDVGYVTVANYNCPGQYVICGDEIAVEAAERYLKEKGAKRHLRLNVSGPFHTKYMEPAAKELDKYLQTVTFEKPKLPVVLNVSGDFYDGKSDLKANLVRQVQSSVRFEDSIRNCLLQGADTFIEIGPGNALTGFVKKTARACGKEVKTYVIDQADDLKTLIAKKEEIYG